MAPIAIIAIWGLAYLRAIYETLQSPGVPVKLDYVAKGGRVARFVADSYAIDLERGTLRVNRPRFETGPEGVLASLEYLDVSGLNALYGANQVVRAHARVLRGRFVRLPSGRFEIEDFLPEQTDRDTDIPFEARIDDVQVRLVDLAGTPWRETLTADTLHVAGIGDDWVASGSGRISNIGSMDVRVQNLQDFGLDITAVSDRLNLTSLFNHLKTTPETKPYPDVRKASLGSLVVRGPVRLFLPTSGSARVESSLVAQIERLRFQDYRADSVVFRGTVTQQGALGSLAARSGANRLDFRGSMRWDQVQRVAGRAQVFSPSPSTLPAAIRDQLPADTRYADAHFDGWVAYNAREGVRVSGDVRASSVAYAGETLTSPVASVRYAQEQLVVRLHSGTVRNERASGLLAFDPKTGRLTGGIDTSRLSLEALAREFGLEGLTGTAIVSATVSGTRERPVVTFNASGSGAFRYGDQRFPVESFQASGTYTPDGLTLRRAIVNSPAGLITARGSVGTRGALGIQVVVRGLRPRLIDSRFGGSGNAEATITGTLENPRVTGRIEGYALTYQNELLPAASARFTATKEQVAFTDLEAVRGSAVIEGRGRFRFADKRIFADLRASGLQVADFLGPEFVGAVEVPSLEISGTLDKPVVSGVLRGTNLLARGVKVDVLNARIDTVNGELQLRDTFAQLAGGAVQATGSINPDTRSGTVTLTATNLDLESLLPEFAPYVSVRGRVSGSASATLRNGELVVANGEGRLADVVVNETPVGSGLWVVSSNEGRIAGELQIGQLDRYLSVENLSYDPDTERIGAEVTAFNLELRDLVAISKRYLPADLPLDARLALNSLEGDLSAAVTIGGTAADPTLNATSFHIGHIKFKDAEFQSLDAQVQKVGDEWTVRSFTLLGDPTPNVGVGKRGQAKLAWSGVINTQGNLELSGDITNMTLAEMSALVPWFTGKTGEVNVSFAASGPTSNPQVRASVEARGLLAEYDPKLLADLVEATASGQALDEAVQRYYDKTLRINLFDIAVTEGSGRTGGIEVEGDYFYKGFQGRIVAKAPFRFPFEIPRDGEVDARVTLVQRDLKEIAQLVEGLDPTRTEGSVRGEVHAFGSPSNLTMEGEAVLTAKRFAFDAVTDVVEDLTARLVLEPRKLELRAEGQSSRGGSLNAQIEAPIEDLEDFAQALQAGLGQELLDNPLRGTARIENLAGSQEVSGGRIAGILSGDFELSGTIGSPLIKGSASLRRVDSQLPSFEAVQTTREMPVINPRFEIDMELADPARIRSSAAELYLLGEGALRGTLFRPRATADLYVDRGSIRLPGSTVRVEQGGTVEVRWSAEPTDNMTAINVDMEGRTAVTAPRLGDVLERYDVYIGIRGDLMKEGGLALTATSDPPDLSQDRILALLGQTELLSGIGSGLTSGGFASDTERQLRGALIGYALPVLLDPVTSGLTKSLGLDYLSLEYNAYEQANLVFAKPLGGGWSLQGRRQITPPPPGFLPQFDIRLVFRPRRLPGIFNRFTFSVGADELRPWKLAIEYGTRF